MVTSTGHIKADWLGRYRYDEVVDLVMSITQNCHVRSFYVARPDLKTDKVRQVDIIYYEDFGFSEEDAMTMQSICDYFPPGKCSVYRSMLDYRTGNKGGRYYDSYQKW